MTPPKVEGAPKPSSSMRISRTFGAPLGGVTRAGQKGLDWAALSSICPPNFCGKGGRMSPGMVVVAAGEPGGGVGIPCAQAETPPKAIKLAIEITIRRDRITEPPQISW